MKIILFLIILFFTSFSHDYREKWVCHTIIDKPTDQYCLVIVIRADTREEAITKFDQHIKRKEKELRCKERSRDAYSITKLKDAIMIEP